MLYDRPIGVILVALLLIVAFTMDFYNGISMVLGTMPIPHVYAALGEFYGILLIFGGFAGLFLFYGTLKLKNWARLILIFGFPAQVIINIILDPTISENYFLLALSLAISAYLLVPSIRDCFTGKSARESS